LPRNTVVKRLCGERHTGRACPSQALKNRPKRPE